MRHHEHQKWRGVTGAHPVVEEVVQAQDAVGVVRVGGVDGAQQLDLIQALVKVVLVVLQQGTMTVCISCCAMQHAQQGNQGSLVSGVHESEDPCIVTAP